MILVFESLIRNATEALGILTTKSFDVRFANLFSVIWGVLVVGVVLGVVVVPELVGVVVCVMLFCSVTDADDGGLIPICRIVSRLTCITATSSSPSGRAWSMSLMIFSASATWSGVPRNTMALCDCKGTRRVMSVRVRT